MFKLETNLHHFRVSTKRSFTSGYTVHWYKLVLNNQQAIGKCMTQSELNTLINYCVNNPTNFGMNFKNYWQCNGETIECFDNTYALVITKLDKIFLKKKPVLMQGFGLQSCMDIELLDAKGNPNHTYNLGFDIFGQIIN